MQDTAIIVAVVGGLVFLAHLFSGIFSRTRIPDVLLLIIIGIALGPASGLISPAHLGAVGPVFVNITLIVRWCNYNTPRGSQQTARYEPDIKWWAILGSNQGPQPYQDCALTS